MQDLELGSCMPIRFILLNEEIPLALDRPSPYDILGEISVRAKLILGP